ncbi:SRPBCC family protein [Schumannella luteola]
MTEHVLPEVTDRDVYITRSFTAPVAVVWKFWTDPELLAQWFGPHGVSVDPATVTVEPRAGGAWNLEMHDDNGVYPVQSTIVEIVEHEYLEGVLAAQTAAGDIEHVYLRVQFHDHGDTTRVALHQGPFDPEFRDMTKAGWLESFEKIDTLIEGGIR